MKKENNRFVPSNTDIKKAKAHTRAIARSAKGQYSGHIECMFEKNTGQFHYFEHIGTGNYTPETENLIYIYSATVREFD